MQEFVSLVNSFPEVLRVFLESEVWIYLYHRLDVPIIQSG